ncbi:YraN family protein, partial [Nostoc sp. HG1]|nr:YraN family protein [Nostoc sp. HG1]
MANLPPSHYPDIGEFRRKHLVAQWLQSTGL